MGCHWRWAAPFSRSSTGSSRHWMLRIHSAEGSDAGTSWAVTGAGLRHSRDPLRDHLATGCSASILRRGLMLERHGLSLALGCAILAILYGIISPLDAHHPFCGGV